jgi:hypothetical protein
VWILSPGKDSGKRLLDKINTFLASLACFTLLIPFRFVYINKPEYIIFFLDPALVNLKPSVRATERLPIITRSHQATPKQQVESNALGIDLCTFFIAFDLHGSNQTEHSHPPRVIIYLCAALLAIANPHRKVSTLISRTLVGYLSS